MSHREQKRKRKKAEEEEAGVKLKGRHTLLTQARLERASVNQNTTRAISSTWGPYDDEEVREREREKEEEIS